MVSEKQLTMEKIGQMAGVSRATVSRVINNNPKVKPELKERVLNVIAKTGFQPNLAARSLVSQRSNVIGLVIPRQVQSLFTDPYFPKLIQGVTQACNAQGYTLALFLFHNQEDERVLYPRILNPSMIDGVILTSSELKTPLIPKFVNNNMPFIVVGTVLDYPQANFVTVDNQNSSQKAVKHLIQQGRKRIATITGSFNTSVGLERYRGYQKALQDAGFTLDETLVAEGSFTENSGYTAMKALLVQQPDAVFVASDTMAFGAIRAIKQANLRIPTDIAVVGFDDLDAAAQTDIALTTIRQPINETGVLAVETLLDIIENGLTPVHHVVLPTQLVIRKTCGAN